MMNTPGEIAKNYLAVGEGKTRLPLGRMFLLAVLAGLYIGLAGLGLFLLGMRYGDRLEAALLSRLRERGGGER